MADDKAVRQRPDESSSVTDDAFTIESASHPQAFTEVPADTTAGTVVESPVVEATAEVVEDESATTVTEPDDDGHVSASRATTDAAQAAAAVAQATPPAKSKSKVPLKERTAQLKHEVDTLTHTKHRTRGEVEAAERRLADLTRQIADNETRLRGTPSKDDKKPVAASATDDAELPMPEFPDYRKFATDEEYETARAKYQADMATWQRADRERLERRLTAGVESRFRDAGAEAQFEAAVKRLETTRDKVAGSKPDWDEKRANLADVQSSWYDPVRHGEAKTPFLSDVARTLLMQGRDEGAELLYWLGEDPDRAQALADLIPTRPMRDALVNAPSVIPLLDHFATEEGRAEFEAMKQMHPIRANQAVGALAVRLAGASSGSSAVSHPITKAQPSARPPAGTPGARGQSGQGTPKRNFADDVLEENAQELMKTARSSGVTLTADDAREHARRRLYG